MENAVKYVCVRVGKYDATWIEGKRYKVYEQARVLRDAMREECVKIYNTASKRMVWKPIEDVVFC